MFRGDNNKFGKAILCEVESFIEIKQRFIFNEY